MNLKLLAASVAACCASIAPAFAQTSVSMYGVVDAGIQVSDFGNKTQYNLASGIADGSRLGFKGTEDLGGGYKAIFTLESRFEVDTGGLSNRYISDAPNENILRGVFANPAFGPAGPLLAQQLSPLLLSQLSNPARVININSGIFDRQAYVGMITPVGGFLLGRQYTPGYEVFAGSDPFEVGTAGSWGNITAGNGGFLGSVGVAIRYNSALQYRIQLPNGIGASLMYAFDEAGATGFSKRAWGGNLRYQGNGINVGIGYNRDQDQNGEKSLTTTTIGGSYTLGSAKVFAGYHRMKNDNSTLVPILQTTLAAGLATAPNGALIANVIAGSIGENLRLDGDVITLGGQYRFGANRVIAGVSRTNDKRPGDNDALLYALGYNYDLSKRTDFYSVISHVKNSGTAQFALGGAGYTGGATYGARQDANAFQIGVRHRF